MSSQLGALKNMPLIVEGLYGKVDGEPYLRIQIYPDHETAGKMGYLTEVHRRLRDGILLALMQTTLMITIPSKTNPETIIVKPTLNDSKDTYEFVLDSEDKHSDIKNAIEHWRRIRATFTRTEIGRSPRRKL